MAEQINEQQQAIQAAQQLTQMVSWLRDFESAVGHFPAVGGVDDEQIEEAQEAVRAARMASAALLGQYVTDSTGMQPQQQPQPSAPVQTQQWAEQPGRRPVFAPRPGEYQQPQQASVQQPQPQPYGGWQ